MKGKEMTSHRGPIIRKVAGHEVHMPDGSILQLGVVELVDGMVRKTYLLTEELAQTEWIGGTITIRQEGENLRAYKNDKTI